MASRTHSSDGLCENNGRNYRQVNSLDVVRQEILMKFVHDKSKSQSIINHENAMLEIFSKIIGSYSSLFEQYDCSLEVSLF